MVDKRSAEDLSAPSSVTSHSSGGAASCTQRTAKELLAGRTFFMDPMLGAPRKVPAIDLELEQANEWILRDD